MTITNSREIYSVIFYLIYYFNLEIECDLKEDDIKLIENNLQEGEEIRGIANNLIDSICDEDYDRIFLRKKDVYKPISLDKLLNKIVCNSMNERCKELFGKNMMQINPPMLNYMVEVTKNHKYTKIVNIIDLYKKFFMSSDFEIEDFINNIKIDKYIIDYIISFLNIIAVSFNIGEEDEENYILFISLLYIYAIIENYKKLKHDYLDTSKEDFYLKLKYKEQNIKQKEDEIVNTTTKYEKEIQNKNKKILELEKEIKKLKKQNVLLENTLSKNENNNKEVVALREYIYKEEKEIIEEKEISLDNIIMDIKQYKIAIFGGRQSTINKMKKILPEYRYIGVDNINFDIKFIENLDYIVICTNYISHAMYYKVINYIRDTDIKLIYINDVNIENVVKRIKDCL